MSRRRIPALGVAIAAVGLAAPLVGSSAMSVASRPLPSPLPSAAASRARPEVPARRGPLGSRCFGAAARDPAHPCRNRRLDHSVAPSLADAAITANLPCTAIETEGHGYVIDGLMQVCAFGTPLASATATVALVGDSHAMNARASLDVVARAEGWRAVAMTRAQCPWSKTILPRPARTRAGCRRWRRRVLAWLGRHPEVSLLFVAEFTSRPRRVATQRGRRQLAADETGYIRAWRALPPTVSHIVVIRDNPRFTTGTFDCIRRALSHRGVPGRACARPRAAALPPDPAALAAQRLHSRRVQVADLTPFICDRRLCYPVVGGVLVNHDTSHLTRLFATTLGPYLLRRVHELARSWG